MALTRDEFDALCREKGYTNPALGALWDMDPKIAEMSVRLGPPPVDFSEDLTEDGEA
ncbi:hypothetical protein [Streptomyces sp. NPDC059378]|uniref:hypothetical protein n=1 Tax=Streptomyces sp. NPDC059378 TaxID=3346815 RepID=UPI0036BD26A8